MFERDLRLNLMDTLLAPAPGPSPEMVQLHQDALELDAPFYAHLACWYQRQGKVRSLQELFIAGLFFSRFSEHREAGWVCLQRLAPYQVARTVALSKQALGRCPRILRSAVAHFLSRQEANPHRFDRVALRQASALKELYAGLHIAPGERAQAVLFRRKPPEGSLSWKVKQLSRCQSPAQQAVQVVELGLPFPMAVGLVRQVTPAVLAALVEVMSPSEVMNHLKMLKTRGALEHPELRQRIQEKLEKARQDSRVSDYRAMVASRQIEDDEICQQLQDVSQHRLTSRGAILKSTALLVDKSSSLEQAIEVGKQVAALAAGLMKAPLHVLVFDTVARPILCQGTTIADWEHAFRGVSACGATSLGAPLAWLRANRIEVEQLVFVTDEEENTSPYLTDEWQLYVKERGVRPEITFVKVGSASDYLERQLRQHKIPFDAYQFRGDSYSLPNLIPFLTRPGRLDLLMEILATPLPTRASREALARTG